MTRMKKIITICSLALIQFILLTPTIEAQITIGSPIEPNPGSLLDVKEQASDANSANAKKGIAWPRVNLETKATLAPAATTTTASKEKHIGLMVYNLTEDSTEDLCEGLYVWDGDGWIRLQGACDGDRCEYSIESNVTPALYYYFYCIDFYTDQQSAVERCKKFDVKNDNDQTTYHLITYQEFTETWNRDAVRFPAPTPGTVDTYFVDYNGWVTLGVIKSNNTMEVLGTGDGFPGGPAIGGLISGEHTVRCVKD